MKAKEITKQKAKSQSSTSRDNHCYYEVIASLNNILDLSRNPLHRGIIIVIE